jgi:hypothetical protein
VPLIDRTDASSWAAPAAWAMVTTVLIVITLTLDPLWAYYGSWAAGFMTAFSAIRAEVSRMQRRRP